MFPLQRLSPEEPRLGLASWQKKLLQQKSGWVCIGQGNAKTFAFLVSVRRQCWIMEAVIVGHRKLELHINTDCHKKWCRVSPPQADTWRALADDTPVHLLDTAVTSIDAGDTCVVQLSVTGAEEIALLPRKRRQLSCASGSDSDLSTLSSGSDVELDNESDRQSLESEEENGSEGSEILSVVEANAPDSDEADMEDNGERAKGSNVVEKYSNQYFTLENYALSSAKEDVKMRVRPRWFGAEPEGMGSVAEKSKTLRTLEYDCNLHAPERAYLVLRCWALWRACQGSWLDHRVPRQRWWHRELEAIKQSVSQLNMPPGTTGSAKADERIRTWLPEVLE